MPKRERSANWKGGVSEDRAVYRRKRRNWKLKAGGSHTSKEWEERKKEFNHTCPCCKKSEPEIMLTEDHIIPLSKGGSDFIENIQPLCRSCNSSKNNKTIIFEKEYVKV